MTETFGHKIKEKWKWKMEKGKKKTDIIPRNRYIKCVRI